MAGTDVTRFETGAQPSYACEIRGLHPSSAGEGIPAITQNQIRFERVYGSVRAPVSDRMLARQPDTTLRINDRFCSTSIYKSNGEGGRYDISKGLMPSRFLHKHMWEEG
jgi:hypothetical protein